MEMYLYMKLTVVCEVRDNADFGLKINCMNGQTCHDIQTIFVCDAHVTAVTCNEDHHILVIKKTPETTWNSIIKSIEGDYTIIIASKDFISIDYSRMILKAAEENDCDIVSCDIAYGSSNGNGFVYSNLSPLRSITILYDNKKLSEMYSKYGLDTADIGMMYGKCIRTTLLKNACENTAFINPKDIYEYVIDASNRFTNIHGAYYFRHEMSLDEKKSFFNSITTPISKGFLDYEDMKSAIAGDKYRIISFDVFDSLILRNVYEPTDLFRFLDDDYNKIFATTSYTRFYKMRICAEEVCRKRVFSVHKDYQDVTLDEIYDTIADLYRLDPVRLDKLKKKEIELEHKFCITRKCGKELYDLALYSGKKVICTSDMYLSPKVISEILEENGYSEVAEVYVSSDTRAGKYTGKAYKELPDWTGCTQDQILHIGDNYEVDVNKARENGIEAFYLPKALDLFWSADKNEIKGKTATFIFCENSSDSDFMSALTGNIGIRCMLALVINKFFDNPFSGFNRDSAYDANPYFIGYFALGMNLWALAEWITEETKQYKKIHFLSRDGYVLKSVYDIMNADKDKVPSCYTYMSRNIVALCDISKKEDIWALREKLNVYLTTPEKIVKMLEVGISEDSIPVIISKLKKAGISYNKKVGNEENFTQTINIVAQYIDWKRIGDYREKLKKYYSEVFRANECIVDAGYNGRVEAAIEELCGTRLDSLYLHAGEDMLYARQNRYSFENKRFYRATPKASFLIREQFISKIAPSVKKIGFEDNKAELIFGELEMDKFTEIITSSIQEAAVEFAQDMMQVFKDYKEYIKYQLGEASCPFDYLCNQGKEIDIGIFGCTEFEDDFGANQKYSLSDYWKEMLDKNNVQKIDGRNVSDYLIFKKYYLKAERFFPKGSKRRTLLRNTVKHLLGKH